MDLMWIVYWMNVLGNLSGLLLFISLSAVTILLMAGGFYFVEVGSRFSDYEKESQERFVYWWKRGGVACVILGLATIFTPDEKTMYMMVGAYATQKVIESPEAKQMADKIMTIVNAKVDEYVEEAKNGKKRK